MIVLKPAGDCKHVFIVCDGCGAEVDVINSLEIPGAVLKNNWRRTNGNYYCSKCSDGH